MTDHTIASVDIDPADLAPREVYFLMTALVVPRPIAWVSTRSAEGVPNVAPHSYFNIISTDPPVVHFTSSGTKDTLRNVRETGEFVVNIVSEELLEEMNLTAADFPPGENEFAWAGLEEAASTTVRAPRVARARAALECTLHSELSIGNGIMAFGSVTHIHVDPELWSDGRVDPAKLAPVGRLAGSLYALSDRIHKLPRPTWDELRTTRGDTE